MRKIMWLLPIVALIVGCGGEDDSYFPLTAGNDWTYDMTGIYTTPSTSDTMTASYMMEIGDATTLDNGTEVFPMVMTMTPDDTTQSGMVDTVYLEETDDYIMVYDSKADTIPSDTVLSFPLELGKTWANYEITDQVDVTVPAGDFSDCWEIMEAIDDDTSYSYWKSGVGVVKMDGTEIDDGNTFTSLMELVDYTVE